MFSETTGNLQQFNWGTTGFRLKSPLPNFHSAHITFLLTLIQPQQIQTSFFHSTLAFNCLCPIAPHPLIIPKHIHIKSAAWLNPKGCRQTKYGQSYIMAVGLSSFNHLGWFLSCSSDNIHAIVSCTQQSDFTSWLTRKCIATPSTVEVLKNNPVSLFNYSTFTHSMRQQCRFISRLLHAIPNLCSWNHSHPHGGLQCSVLQGDITSTITVLSTHQHL